MAAVTVNNHTSANGGAVTVTSGSWSHTATGDNYLVVTLTLRNAVSALTCTYNSVSMTLLDSSVSNTLAQVFTFGLANPTTGPNSIAASWTGSAFWTGVSSSVSGWVSTGTTQKQTSTTTGNSDLTVTTTLGANDLFLGGGGADNGASSVSITTGVFLDSTAVTTAVASISGYNTGSGSVSIVMHIVAGDQQALIGVPLIGAVAVAPKNSGLLLLGVG